VIGGIISRRLHPGESQRAAGVSTRNAWYVLADYLSIAYRAVVKWSADTAKALLRLGFHGCQCGHVHNAARGDKGSQDMNRSGGTQQDGSHMQAIGHHLGYIE